MNPAHTVFCFCQHRKLLRTSHYSQQFRLQICVSVIAAHLKDPLCMLSIFWHYQVLISKTCEFPCREWPRIWCRWTEHVVSQTGLDKWFWCGEALQRVLGSEGWWKLAVVGRWWPGPFRPCRQVRPTWLHAIVINIRIEYMLKGSLQFVVDMHTWCASLACVLLRRCTLQFHWWTIFGLLVCLVAGLASRSQNSVLRPWLRSFRWIL